MSLASHVQALIGSEPFERLLTSRARPIEVQAETGDAFVLAGLATALELPILAVAPGPHEAEALVADVEAFLPGGAALLPAWEALPYELISPTPEIAARRAAAIRRLRAPDGPLVVVAPVLAVLQGIAPTAGLGRADPAGEGRGGGARRARGTAGGARVSPRGRRRAPGGVRGPRRGAGCVPGRAAPADASGVLGRRDRLDPSLRALDAAVGERGRCRRDRSGARADPR